jgi:hypothetical protein
MVILLHRQIADYFALRNAIHTVMTHTAPSDQIVLTCDTDQGKKLVASSGDYTYIWPGRPPVIRSEPVLSSIIKRLPSGGLMLSGPGAIILCHEMRTPSGHSFLVVIDLTYKGTWDAIPMRFGATLFEPGTWLSEPEGVQDQLCKISFQAGLLARQNLRIYAGQIDRNDPSHATIPYEMDDQRGVMDIYLREDKDVVITVQSGPAKRLIPDNQ